jgi:hypothetical protein
MRGRYPRKLGASAARHERQICLTMCGKKNRESGSRRNARDELRRRRRRRRGFICD